jgi:hypothetical protein
MRRSKLDLSIKLEIQILTCVPAHCFIEHRQRGQVRLLCQD